MNSLIPRDLADFLKLSKVLNANWDKTHSGRISLKLFEELRVGYIYVAPLKKEDPNIQNDGVY